MTYPGGYFVSYTYDALNQLDVVTDSGGVQLANNGPGALTFTFGRNLSGQITSIGASDGAFLSRPGVTKTETVTSNRLNQVSSVVGPGGTSTYTHDANGNLTSDGSFIFAYDEENRLRTVALPATPGTPFASYEYDPLGRRRAKVVNGVATRYVSDGAEEIEERNGSNGLLRQFVNGAGIDEHIAILDATLCPGGGRCFLRTNWQGSTTHLVAQSGALVETYHYGPYGERVDWTPQDGDSGNPYRYTGRRHDAETGLYYYRARYYSPKLGRFLQADPIGTKDDLNLYGYIGENPSNSRDPYGLYECRGTPSQCNTIKNFVAGITAAKSRLDRSSDAYKKLAKVLQFLGSYGQKNGIALGASSLSGSRIGEAHGNGRIDIDVRKINGYSDLAQASNPGMSASSAVQALGAGVVAHEARHEIDAVARGGPAASRPEAYRTELNAYKTEQSVHVGLGFRSLLNLIGPSGRDESASDLAVEKGAERSASEVWCGEHTPCP